MIAALPMRPLRPGMRIAVVAPASPFPADDFARGVARLRERYDVRFDERILERAGFLAGDDERRLGELVRAIEDDGVDAILAARGGYGATRLLPRLAVAAVRRAGKPLIGFSDITALHALWARAELGSLHASMAAALARADEGRFARWVGAIEGALPPPITGLQALSLGPRRVRGRLFGGNLTVLTALIGTPYAPPLDGCVLFMEDHGERPYRIDRMLTSLRQAGWLERPSAFVLGTFTECAPGADGVSAPDVLQANLVDLGVPVLSGVPAGHIDDNLELPLGAIVEVDADTGCLSFEGAHR